MGNVKQWARDAVHMGRRLRGAVPPPVTYTARTRSRTTTSSDREATVLAITRLTPDAVTLRLRTGPMELRAGQFVTLGVPVLGRVHRRNYSVSSAPTSGPCSEIDVTVKRVPGGVVSTFLCAHAKVGDRMSLSGPHGSFVRPAGHVGPLVLVAAGSGVTPLYSILLSELARTRDIALLYGNRSTETTIFHDELAALAREHASLRVLHAHEEPVTANDGAVYAGRLDAALIARMLDAIPFAADPDALYFLCGPEPVRAAARSVCAARGIPAARILEERYTTSSPREEHTAQDVTFRTGPDGKGRTVSLTLAPGETLLAGATRAGIAAPFSCAMGGCGDCRMRLVSGECHDGGAELSPSVGENAR